MPTPVEDTIQPGNVAEVNTLQHIALIICLQRLAEKVVAKIPDVLDGDDPHRWAVETYAAELESPINLHRARKVHANPRDLP